MTATAGCKAIVQIGSTPVTITGITTADLTIAGDVYDITDLNNNTWKIKLGGLTDSTLKLAGNHDMSDAEQTALQGYILTTPGTVATWKIWPAGTGATHYYTGTAIVKQMGIKFDVMKQNQISFDLEGTGAVTYV